MLFCFYCLALLISTFLKRESSAKKLAEQLLLMIPAPDFFHKPAFQGSAKGSAMGSKGKVLKKRVKRTFSIHHWIGLVLGIFLLVASITGSILVFHHEIDHAQFAEASTLAEPAAELNIDNSFGRINSLHPGADIRVPHFPEDPGEALKYEIREGSTRKWIFAHPETGKTLATVERADQRLVHVLLDLHYNLLSGTPGKLIVLLGGIALIVLTITGFILYRKSILKVLAFRQKVPLRNKRSFFSALHRVVGVWSLVFNLLISITGSWIAYTIVESALSPAAAAKKASASLSTPLADAGLRQVKTDYPDFEIKYLRFADGKLFVLGRLASDPLIYGRTASRIEINTGTGRIGKVNFLRDASWNQQAIAVLKPLHFGNYAGLGVKIIYSFFGIFPGILAISGFVIWRNRRITKRPVQSKARSKPLVPSAVA